MNEKETQKEIDYTSPEFIVVCIAAVLADALVIATIFSIGILFISPLSILSAEVKAVFKSFFGGDYVPTGFLLAAFAPVALVVEGICILIILGFMMPKLNNVWSRIVLLLNINPLLPIHTAITFIAVALNNKAVRWITKQVVKRGIEAATGPIGVAVVEGEQKLEAAEAAERGLEATQRAAQAAQAAGKQGGVGQRVADYANRRLQADNDNDEAGGNQKSYDESNIPAGAFGEQEEPIEEAVEEEFTEEGLRDLVADNENVTMEEDGTPNLRKRASNDNEPPATRRAG